MVYQMVDVVDLKHSHADGVVVGIDKGLGKIGFSLEKLADGNSDFPNLVSKNYDSASGSVNGTAAKILWKIPHAVAVHCVAHNLELGILDSVKNYDYLKEFESTVKGIFKFYTYSHQR